jgi:trigger factor
MTGMTMEQFRAVFTPQALRQVKIRLALEKVAELEGMDITEEDLNAEFDKLAENNKMDIEKVKELLAAEDLKADMLCQKANDFILANAVAVAKKEAAAE